MGSTLIHSAAIKLFAKKGFAAASVKNIADEAGISIGLMYRHYKNKEDLFHELVAYAAEGLGRIVELFQSDGTPVELIRQFTMEILNALNNDDEYAQFQMLMNQSLSMDDQSPQIKQLAKKSEEMLQQLIQLIEKGQKLGQFKQGNAKEMAYFYFSAIQGLAMMKIMKNEDFITPSVEIVTSFLVEN